MRLTHNAVAIAAQLAANPSDPHWQYDIHQRTGIHPGPVHHALARMHAAGWLDAHDENPADRAGGRPLRRYYTLTDTGRREIAALLGRAAGDPRYAHLLGDTPSGQVTRR